ncbi:hypothetical protein TYRP_020773 [Tyrophagus putrescentiae]|nr:hypothetical protein TYRP_020773 [Tyrophagus putrescentiae]
MMVVMVPVTVTAVIVANWPTCQEDSRRYADLRLTVLGEIDVAHWLGELHDQLLEGELVFAVRRMAVRSTAGRWSAPAGGLFPLAKVDEVLLQAGTVRGERQLTSLFNCLRQRGQTLGSGEELVWLTLAVQSLLVVLPVQQLHVVDVVEDTAEEVKLRVAQNGRLVFVLFDHLAH